MKRASERSGRGAAALAGRPRRRPAETALPHGDPERLGALLTSLEPIAPALVGEFPIARLLHDAVHPGHPPSAPGLGEEQGNVKNARKIRFAILTMNQHHLTVHM